MQRNWWRRLIDDPSAFGTMLAAFAALLTVIVSSWATRDAISEATLDNAPALYLACTQRPGASADIFYPVADVVDFPGAYSESEQPMLLCSITNVSRRPLVNIRMGFLALFYDRKPGTTSVAPFEQRLVFPDDGPLGITPARPQTINLAPNAKITFALPNASFHYLLIDPTERADVHFPGDDKPRCADVYLAPGTARLLEQPPMPPLPRPIPTETAGNIPSPPPSNCIDFEAIRNATPATAAWIPSVAGKFVFKKGGDSALIQLPHQ